MYVANESIFPSPQPLLSGAMSDVGRGQGEEQPLPRGKEEKLITVDALSHMTFVEMIDRFTASCVLGKSEGHPDFPKSPGCEVLLCSLENVCTNGGYGDNSRDVLVAFFCNALAYLPPEEEENGNQLWLSDRLPQPTNPLLRSLRKAPPKDALLALQIGGVIALCTQREQSGIAIRSHGDWWALQFHCEGFNLLIPLDLYEFDVSEIKDLKAFVEIIERIIFTSATPLERARHPREALRDIFIRIGLDGEKIKKTAEALFFSQQDFKHYLGFLLLSALLPIGHTDEEFARILRLLPGMIQLRGERGELLKQYLASLLQLCVRRGELAAAVANFGAAPAAQVAYVHALIDTKQEALVNLARDRWEQIPNNEKNKATLRFATQLLPFDLSASLDLFKRYIDGQPINDGEALSAYFNLLLQKQDLATHKAKLISLMYALVATEDETFVLHAAKLWNIIPDDEKDKEALLFASKLVPFRPIAALKPFERHLDNLSADDAGGEMPPLANELVTAVLQIPVESKRFAEAVKMLNGIIPKLFACYSGNALTAFTAFFSQYVVFIPGDTLELLKEAANRAKSRTEAASQAKAHRKPSKKAVRQAQVSPKLVEQLLGPTDLSEEHWKRLEVLVVEEETEALGTAILAVLNKRSLHSPTKRRKIGQIAAAKINVLFERQPTGVTHLIDVTYRQLLNGVEVKRLEERLLTLSLDLGELSSAVKQWGKLSAISPNPIPTFAQLSQRLFAALLGSESHLGEIRSLLEYFKVPPQVEQQMRVKLLKFYLNQGDLALAVVQWETLAASENKETAQEFTEPLFTALADSPPNFERVASLMQAYPAFVTDPMRRQLGEKLLAKCIELRRFALAIALWESLYLLRPHSQNFGDLTHALLTELIAAIELLDENLLEGMIRILTLLQDSPLVDFAKRAFYIHCLFDDVPKEEWKEKCAPLLLSLDLSLFSDPRTKGGHIQKVLQLREIPADFRRTVAVHVPALVEFYKSDFQEGEKLIEACKKNGVEIDRAMVAHFFLSAINSALSTKDHGSVSLRRKAMRRFLDGKEFASFLGQQKGDDKGLSQQVALYAPATFVEWQPLFESMGDRRRPLVPFFVGWLKENQDGTNLRPFFDYLFSLRLAEFSQLDPLFNELLNLLSDESSTFATLLKNQPADLEYIVFEVIHRINSDTPEAAYKIFCRLPIEQLVQQKMLPQARLLGWVSLFIDRTDLLHENLRLLNLLVSGDCTEVKKPFLFSFLASAISMLKGPGELVTKMQAVLSLSLKLYSKEQLFSQAQKIMERPDKKLALELLKPFVADLFSEFLPPSHPHYQTYRAYMTLRTEQEKDKKEVKKGVVKPVAPRPQPAAPQKLQTPKAHPQGQIAPPYMDKTSQFQYDHVRQMQMLAVQNPMPMYGPPGAMYPQGPMYSPGLIYLPGRSFQPAEGYSQQPFLESVDDSEEDSFGSVNV